MLVALSIRSVALIESAQLQFAPGMTAFTGETGAGKSILLDAIGLVLGNRGDTALIRRGAEVASVQALFHIPPAQQSAMSEQLREWGMETEDGEILITRELHRSGRTVCRLNGKIATVQMLRALGNALVDQQGQNESYRLNQPETQLQLLDLYGQHGPLLDGVAQAYVAWKDAQAVWRTAQMDEQERMRRLDMLSYQIEEIDAADLMEGEESALRTDRKRLQHAGRILALLSTAVNHLSGVDSNAGAVDALAEASSNLESAAEFDLRFKEVVALLDTAVVHAEEAARAIQKHLLDIDDDPQRLEEVDNRLALIRSLERKYGPSTETILAHLQSARNEHDTLVRHEEHLHQLEQHLTATTQTLSANCAALHEARGQAAQQLSESVETILHALNMPSARFEVGVEMRGDGHGQPHFGPGGFDAVEFRFSANRGESLRPLARVASGGELSRLLLAIQSVLAELDDVDTLIFDEIDTGVSGYAVERIGEQLKLLSEKRQTFCVTHSPQVAATADEHWLIMKSEAGEATTTAITRLDQAGRVAEISRLIGGGVSDHTALAHATALLQKSTSRRDVTFG